MRRSTVTFDYYNPRSAHGTASPPKNRHFGMHAQNIDLETQHAKLEAEENDAYSTSGRQQPRKKLTDEEMEIYKILKASYKQT